MKTGIRTKRWRRRRAAIRQDWALGTPVPFHRLRKVWGDPFGPYPQPLQGVLGRSNRVGAVFSRRFLETLLGARMASRNRRDFGSIRLRGKGKHQAYFTDGDGQRRSLGIFPTRADANAALAEVEAGLRRGNSIDLGQARRTLAEVSRLWLASNPHKRHDTYATDDVDIERHIIPALGRLRIGSIGPSDVQRAVNAWSETAAPRTVKRRLGTLRAIFNFAVNNDWLTRSPVRNVKPPKVTSTRSFQLSDDQVIQIAEATAARYRPMVYLAAVTGCRWSEAAGLRVGDLDLLSRRMSVEQVVVRGEHGRPSIDAPKSAASRRTIALPSSLVEMLAEHLAQLGLTGADRSSLVFPDTAGGPLRQSNWRSRVWLPALRAVGLADLNPRPGFHDLRRAAATALVRSGFDPKTVQRRLGHADVLTTLQIYAQSTEEGDRHAADALGSRLMGVTGESVAPMARPDSDDQSERPHVAHQSGRNSRSARARYPDDPLGGVAQLAERYVRNVEVGGSSPLTSTPPRLHTRLHTRLHMQVLVSAASLHRHSCCQPRRISVLGRPLW